MFGVINYRQSYLLTFGVIRYEQSYLSNGNENFCGTLHYRPTKNDKSPPQKETGGEREGSVSHNSIAAAYSICRDGAVVALRETAHMAHAKDRSLPVDHESDIANT